MSTTVSAGRQSISGHGSRSGGVGEGGGSGVGGRVGAALIKESVLQLRGGSLREAEGGRRSRLSQSALCGARAVPSFRADREGRSGLSSPRAKSLSATLESGQQAGWPWFRRAFAAQDIAHTVCRGFPAR